MRKSIITGAAVALSLAVAGTAQADTVNSLDGDWSANNSTVTKVTGGVHFGTYADGGALAGSLLYKGANGVKLGDVSDFSFTFNYKQSGSATAATPYGRIWLDTNKNGKVDWTGDPATDDATVMFDPSLGGGVLLPVGADITFGNGDDSVRYADDAGESGQLSWDEVKSLHPNEEIIQVGVSQGNAGGKDVSAMLKNIKLNGETFDFTAAPADGQNGAPGQNGADGSNGTDGRNGVNGITTIIHDHGKLSGDTMRTLRAPSIKGKKFVSARASMRGKRLRTRGRSIKVDLRGKTAGNYNILIVAKYKTKRGKVQTVRSIRTLSITRS